jgi:hypothetical protein
MQTGVCRKPYYTVGEKIVLSAVDACKENLRTGRSMVFHPGLDFLDSPAWRVEPPETIQELRLRRAQQIREKYDNIILFCSGGTDSTPILRTFVENNIPIERVGIAINDDWATLRNWEFNTLVFPGLKKYLHDHNYEVKVDVYKGSTYLKEHAYGWETASEGTAPIITPTGFQPWMTQDVFKFRGEKGKTCVIAGREKPTIVVSGGSWCWTSLDKMLFSQETDLNNEFIPVEEFYLTDDMPEIQIKLAWLKAKFLESSMPDRIDLDGLQEEAMRPLNNEIGKYNGELLSLQGSMGPLYQGCCAAMDLQAIHPWLAQPGTQSINPEFWIRDIKNAFQGNEHLLKVFEGYNRELIRELPERYFNEDNLYKGLLEETRVLSGIWGMPVPMKPFSRILT